MSNYVLHTYHLVDESPWPLISSLARFFLTLGFIQFFYLQLNKLINMAILCILLCMLQWWTDVRAEGTFLGLHASSVVLGLRWGIILFITSEIIFFFSFFWTFFHRRLSPDTEIGTSWAPLNIITLNSFQVPLLNTFILISSGLSVTWAHHATITREHSQVNRSLFLTVILGAYFTVLQGLEYQEARFRIADRIYGATFFLATGFHGFHVIVGTLFLLVTLFRTNKQHFRSDHHFGFEAAAWYWHFVDVVWLFLFISIYWWGRV